MNSYQHGWMAPASRYLKLQDGDQCLFFELTRKQGEWDKTGFHLEIKSSNFYDSTLDWCSGQFTLFTPMLLTYVVIHSVKSAQLPYLLSFLFHGTESGWFEFSRVDYCREKCIYLVFRNISFDFTMTRLFHKEDHERFRPEVKAIDFVDCNLTSLEWLRGLIDLTTVSLMGTTDPINMYFYQELGKLPKLKHITFSNVPMNVTDLGHFSKSLESFFRTKPPLLEVLCINRMLQVGPKTIMLVAECCPRLQTFNCDRNFLLTAAEALAVTNTYLKHPTWLGFCNDLPADPTGPELIHIENHMSMGDWKYEFFTEMKIIGLFIRHRQNQKRRKKGIGRLSLDMFRMIKEMLIRPLVYIPPPPT